MAANDAVLEAAKAQKPPEAYAARPQLSRAF
jgi:hypothetical protein